MLAIASWETDRGFGRQRVDHERKLNIFFPRFSLGLERCLLCSFTFRRLAQHFRVFPTFVPDFSRYLLYSMIFSADSGSRFS